MIVVVGSPLLADETLRPGRRAAGVATDVALAAAEAGAGVELVGKVGDDPDGDGLVVELEREGVGHAALQRDPALRTPRVRAGSVPRLSRADVELALRYLPDARVIVQVDQSDPAVAEVLIEAAGFAGAHLVLIEAGSATASGTEALAARGLLTRLRPPARDEGPFARFLGRYAAALDGDRAPADAFRAAVADVGWEPAHA
jgi:pfkB family carbohydrate kinase